MLIIDSGKIWFNVSDVTYDNEHKVCCFDWWKEMPYVILISGAHKQKLCLNPSFEGLLVGPTL